MGQTTEIILWTFSLLIGVLGITFGIVASKSATQANKSIKDLISNSIVVEETQKLFFDGLKSSITQSKKAIRKLKVDDITYYDYSIISANTRIHPIASRVFKAFVNTEYKDVTELYVETKKYLDDKYSTIISDFTILKTERKIPVGIKTKLIDYHNHSIDSIGAIITLYTSLTQGIQTKQK